MSEPSPPLTIFLGNFCVFQSQNAAYRKLHSGPPRPMKRLLSTLAVLALFPLLAGCGEQWSWRQKLVLEVETPNSTVSGGSVVQVKLHRVPGWLPSNNPGAILSDVKGEASFVEIAPGRYLFALLRGGGEAQLAREMFFPYPAADVPEANSRLEEFTGRAVLPSKAYPRLVTFTDISDPKTVRRVDPDDLAASFGPGYRLKSVTLEITDEPVTNGEVEKVLGWLDEYEQKNLQLDGERYRNARSEQYASRLNVLDFIRR
jgi:hypothetical protein